MYIPGEALGIETIGSRAEFSTGSPIHHVSPMPGLLARNPRLVLLDDMPEVNYDLAKALFKLDEYDIGFPGVGSLVERSSSSIVKERGHAYSTLSWVDGLNMHHDMSKIPFDVTRTALANIISYYEAAAQDESGELFLTDMSLRQCVYGNVAQNGAQASQSPSVYFVDYDLLLSNVQSLREGSYGKPGFYGVGHLNEDLEALKSTFPGHDVEDLSTRLMFLTRRLCTRGESPAAQVSS